MPQHLSENLNLLVKTGNCNLGLQFPWPSEVSADIIRALSNHVWQDHILVNLWVKNLQLDKTTGPDSADYQSGLALRLLLLQHNGVYLDLHLQIH